MSERISRIVLTVLLVAAAILVAQDAYFLRLAKTEYTFFTTFISVTVLHIRLRHKLSELGLLALSTAALVAIAARRDHFPPGAPLCLTCLGLASLVILGIRMAWWPKGARAVIVWGFAAGLSIVCLGWVIPSMLTWVAKSNPKGFDLYLYSFDGSLRFQPSFLLGRAFLMWPLFGKFSTAVYMAISSIYMFVFADLLLREVKKAKAVFLAFLVSGPVGILFYNLFPALGPLYLFGGNFPLRPLPATAIQHLRLEPISLYGFPNAMPSLHMTWALLAMWYARGAAWWVRLVASVFLAFTVLSTLGTGEHYLADLVVAMPFSLMLLAAFSFSSAWADAWRIRAIVFGLAATVLWMTLLRFQPHFFWISPGIPWTLITLTVAATVFLEGRLGVSSEREITSFERAKVPEPGSAEGLRPDTSPS
jgi:PAP2 superfamily protein